MVWNNSYDSNNDIISYHLIIDDNPTFNNPEVNVSAITNTTPLNTTYEVSTILDVDTLYYWKVRANDSSGYGDFSNVSEFTLDSYLAMDLLVSSVAFGSIEGGTSNDTTDGIPLPFRGENTGNVLANISVNASSFFSSGSFPSSAYQFKIRENESNSFNTSLSNTTWLNMSSADTGTHVMDWNWQDIKDDFLLDINVSPRSDEPVGDKSSTLTFTMTWG